MQNAGKFGLQTAAGYGEPWHVQMAGTPMGDPMPYGDATDFITGPISDFLSQGLNDVAKGIIQGLGSMFQSIMQPLLTPIQDLLKQFIGKGGYSDLLQGATNFFSKLLTAPMSGMMKIFGPGPAMSNSDILGMIDQPQNLTVPVVGAFKGAGGGGASGGQIFGDPMSLLSMAPSSGGGGGGTPVLIFHAPITIQGGGSGIDARQMASTIASHLEEEANKRQWLVQ